MATATIEKRETIEPTILVNDVSTFHADHMPYGGVKKSGIGGEGPHFAVEEMTELKLICWRG